MRLVLAILLALSCACSTTSSSGPSEAEGGLGSPCTTPEDCVEGVCAFPVDAGCKARGRCVIVNVTCSGDGAVVCACDGTPVELACGYGTGNAPAPVPFPLPTSTSSCLPSIDAATDAAEDSE